VLCCCDVALVLEIDKGKEYLAGKWFQLILQCSELDQPLGLARSKISDWPVACLRKDQTALLAVGDCRERGARGEAEEFVSSEAPTSRTRLNENTNKAVIANDCNTRAMRG
jgi:hypothetical protein